jgi:polyhydroxyalkanoate synthesis regulator phasin
MNQEQKLQKLFEILETVDKGFATSDEVAEICSQIINSVKQLKTVTEEQYKDITSKIGVILSNHNVLSRDLDHSSDILSKEITALKKVVANLKLQHGKDGKDGKDADIDLVAEKASKLAQNDLINILPKELKLEDVLKDLPAYGEKVRDALELLQGEERLDASAIKGLQEIIKGLKQEKATIIGANKPLSGLLDVDVAGILPNQSIKWNGQTWVAYTPSDGVSSFTELSDTPNAYTSQGGKVVRVNGDEDGLEFYTTDDSDEKVKLNASDPTAGYLDDKITGYGFITNISGQDLSIADNSISQFITLGDIPTETDPEFNAWLDTNPLAGFITGVKFNEIDDPDDNSVISMGGNTITWNFTNPIGGMLFNMTGGWSGHVLEVMDTSATPDGGLGDHLMHLETSRLNVLPAHFVNNAVGGRALLAEGISKFVGDTILDDLKSKTILGTDANGKIIEGTHQDISGKENSLGNPSVDDYVLSSKADGTRSWVEMSGGGGSTTKTSETKVDNYTVLTGDSSKTLIMNATTEKTFTLPAVDATNIGTWYTFVKINTGKLNIAANGTAVIMDSGEGKTIYNAITDETYATITLQLVTATKWVTTGGMGNWVTTI